MGNVNKQLDRHQLFDIQKRTTLSAKEIKEWYSLFMKQFQDTKVSKDKYLPSLKIHSLPSSYENTTTIITTTSPSLNNSNTNGNNSSLNNQQLDSNEISDKQVEIEIVDKKEMTTSTAPNHEKQEPKKLTDLTYPELIYDTTHLSFLKYFYSEDYPGSNYRKSQLQFVHFIPSYEIYLKGNRVSQADWTYTAITSQKRMEDTEPEKKKKHTPFSISFHDLSVFFEVIYGYLQLRPFEIGKLPKHLHSPEACTRYVFQNVLNFVGIDTDNLENKAISKQQFMDYCFHKLSQESTQVLEQSSQTNLVN
ncbi:Hypothetical protein NAEGRDRAFT_80964 [Naegleria gruberi]|uniref:Uncharacterized protein n=1 Tax=Naegleria gruberi TaxID=5762 RepID=D2VRD2_NAEGR|nr:uncharacterized protein NAEGRDRAFT_80964 [Naegleria gruberi]EFC40587.1 Hypothetical protein NAEGRDRAFT_80964 [Naegleria gruberi]|eukprot:XP_002673331.1 Hypothetical protein NAEGRDRAFT_80964 [Naegleria gruberi strain NEG-M]